MCEPFTCGLRFKEVGFHFNIVEVFPEAVAAYQECVAVLRVDRIVRLRKLKRLGIAQYLEQTRAIRAVPNVVVGHFSHINGSLTH